MYRLLDILLVTHSSGNPQSLSAPGLSPFRAFSPPSSGAGGFCGLREQPIGYRTWLSLPAACKPCHHHCGARQPRALRGRAQSSAQRGLRPHLRAQPGPPPGPGTPPAARPGEHPDVCARALPSPVPAYPPGRHSRGGAPYPAVRVTAAGAGRGPGRTPGPRRPRGSPCTPRPNQAQPPPAESGRAEKCKVFVALRGAATLCRPKAPVNGEKRDVSPLPPKYYRTVWVRFPAEAAAGKAGPAAWLPAAASRGARSDQRNGSIYAPLSPPSPFSRSAAGSRRPRTAESSPF